VRTQAGSITADGSSTMSVGRESHGWHLDPPRQAGEFLDMNRPWADACYAPKSSWTSQRESPMGASGDVFLRTPKERGLMTNQAVGGGGVSPASEPPAET